MNPCTKLKVRAVLCSIYIPQTDHSFNIRNSTKVNVFFYYLPDTNTQIEPINLKKPVIGIEEALQFTSKF